MGLFSSAKKLAKSAVSGFVGSGGTPWGAVAGAGLGLVGDMISTNSANANAKRAAANQNANNVYNMQHSYQWTMQDMKNAGLNPILAAQNGANSVGNAAEANTFKTNAAESMAGMANAASQTSLNSATAVKTMKEAGVIEPKAEAEIKKMASETALNEQQTALARSNIDLNSAKKLESKANAKYQNERARGYSKSYSGGAKGSFNGGWKGVKVEGGANGSYSKTW